jgi:hypothetical protein
VVVPYPSVHVNRHVCPLTLDSDLDIRLTRCAVDSGLVTIIDHIDGIKSDILTGLALKTLSRKGRGEHKVSTSS